MAKLPTASIEDSLISVGVHYGTMIGAGMFLIGAGLLVIVLTRAGSGGNSPSRRVPPRVRPGAPPTRRR